MAESILVTGLKISNMELVTSVTGSEKLPTGQDGDLAITPNQIADHTIERGDLVSQEDLSQVEVNLTTQIENTNLEVTNQTTQIRNLLSNETTARINGDADLSNQISDLTTDFQSALDAEKVARESADNLKVDKEGSVVSVSGRTGEVVLSPNDIGYPSLPILDERTKKAIHVIDDSGKTQQDVNDIQLQDGVSVQPYYEQSGDLGVAIENAYADAVARGIKVVKIPDGVFHSTTTADLDLTGNFTLKGSAGTVIYVDNPVTFLDVSCLNHTLVLLGFGASLYPNWAGTSTVSAVKILSETLGKSLYWHDFNIYETTTTTFNRGIDSTGLNYSTVVDSVIQATDPLVNASHTSGTNYHSMGSEVIRCKLHAKDTSVTLVNNGDLGCEGWKFSGGEYFGDTGISVIDNLNSASYFPPLLLVQGVHMNNERFMSISGVSRLKVLGCDLQAQVSSSNTHKGLFEIDGVQVLNIDPTTAISQAETTGIIPNDSLPVIYVRDSAKSRTSAFWSFDITNFWLNQSEPLIDFQVTNQMYDRVFLSGITGSAFSGNIVKTEHTGLVSIHESARLTDSQVASNYTLTTSLDSSYNSTTGVLTLAKTPSYGSLYQIPTSVLPNGSVINQIKTTECIGREYTLVIDGNDITVNHNANLLIPAGLPNKILNGTVMKLINYNTEQVRITAFLPNTVSIPTTVPTSTASFGIHGQRIYSSGYVYEYFSGTGWVRHTASTF